MAKWVDAPESERIPLAPIMGRGRPSFAYQPPRQFPTFSQRNIGAGSSSSLPIPVKVPSNQLSKHSFDEAHVVFSQQIAAPVSSVSDIDSKAEVSNLSITSSADAADTFVHLQRQIIGNAIEAQALKNGVISPDNSTSNPELLSEK
jgi:hypothetical protein